MLWLASLMELGWFDEPVHWIRIYGPSYLTSHFIIPLPLPRHGNGLPSGNFSSRINGCIFQVSGNGRCNENPNCHDHQFLIGHGFPSHINSRKAANWLLVWTIQGWGLSWSRSLFNLIILCNTAACCYFLLAEWFSNKGLSGEKSLLLKMLL